jgi:hypothetical protein
MKDIAVYTIILNNYDISNILLDKYREENIDYYFITDCKSAIVPGYNMVYIDSDSKNPRQTYRYYKSRIPDFIRSYKYSIYYDGNVIVKKPLSDLINYVQNYDIAILINPMLMNVYFHFRLYKKKNIILKKIYDRYIDDGFQDNINVNNKFIIRKHSKSMFEFSDLWYKESKLIQFDELSILYCVYKSNIKIYKIYNYFHFFNYFSIKFHNGSITNKHRTNKSKILLYHLYQFIVFNNIKILIILLFSGIMYLLKWMF